MGKLVDGKWMTEQKLQESGHIQSESGAFEREKSQFCYGWIGTDDADSVPVGRYRYPADLKRYHLYVAWACPWAHRVLIYRELLGLQDMGVSIVNPLMLDKGWSFAEGPGVVPDPCLNAQYLYEIYQAADRDYTGRVTVPVLWDKQSETIVSNESADIIRMFGQAFAPHGIDYYPENLREQIDELNQRIYVNVNNAVYRAGFASVQSAYDEAVQDLFETLDALEGRLARQRYLLGDSITEADWRFFPTLVRFDPVYAIHFKCSRRRLIDYPNLWAYTRDLYQQPGIARTMNIELTKLHYYGSHKSINPHGLIPATAPLEFDAPHHRGDGAFNSHWRSRHARTARPR